MPNSWVERGVERDLRLSLERHEAGNAVAGLVRVVGEVSSGRAGDIHRGGVLAVGVQREHPPAGRGEVVSRHLVESRWTWGFGLLNRRPWGPVRTASAE